jgi:ornithine--oxo-acid transaminase
MNPFIELEDRYSANNYTPLPIVLTRGQGVYLWDDSDNCYIDMMSAYSAVSHGHCHPELVAELTKQAQTLAIVSRAYHTDKLGEFLARVCELVALPKALPMNSGAEAVETAIKAVRKWAYKVKGVADNLAEIIVCENNFHGRTTTIVGMSSEPQYKKGFGPFAPGFKLIPYGDAQALEKAITKNTAAFLVEPIQGEGGIVLPPDGYLKQCAEICRQHNVLLICDEIQTGLCRTGKFLCCQYDNVLPDGVLLGKSLGGGLLPVSLFLAREDLMGVFEPGDHGSTFGGNALASAVALAALNIMIRDNYSARSAELGAYMLAELKNIHNSAIKEVRGKGLYIAVEINTSVISARELCLRLMKKGILSKDTHNTVIRLAPPLVITKTEIDQAVDRIKQVFSEI